MVGETADDHTVVGRALAVIEAVATCGADVTLAELASTTGIPKPTVLRIAHNLTQRRLLKRTIHGYALGPELSRLGATAALHHHFDRYLPVLDELQAAHGGVGWLMAGRELVNLRPVAMVYDSGFPAAKAWPADTSSTAMLTNTAGGHLILAHRPDLLERIARQGITPATPNSVREPRELAAAVHRARRDGVAVESEQATLGWSCAAALLPTISDQLALIGVTVPVGRANSRELLRAVLRAFDAVLTEPGPLTGARQPPTVAHSDSN
jgi:DNA-binding IclR family transcriptional regulator